MDERTATVNIGGQEYEMLLTTRATKAIAGRYGGLENLGEKLMKAENFEMALDEIVWLITLLCNQPILVHNLKHPEDKKPELTVEEVELLTSPMELIAMSKTPHTQYLCMFARHGNLFYHSKFIVTTSSKWYN